jgi:hypothetical protein
LSSGYCLSTIKNFDENEEDILIDRILPCIKPAFKNECSIDCISFNCPNILKEKRPTISIGIVKVKMVGNSPPKISYYGDTGEGNYISNLSLETEKLSENFFPTVKDVSSSVNKLFLVDLDKIECGRIKVNNILVEKNEAIGIFLRVNDFIYNNGDTQIYDYNQIYNNVRPFNLSVHIKEVSKIDINELRIKKIKYI